MALVTHEAVISKSRGHLISLNGAWLNISECLPCLPIVLNSHGGPGNFKQFLHEHPTISLLSLPWLSVRRRKLILRRMRGPYECLPAILSLVLEEFLNLFPRYWKRPRSVWEALGSVRKTGLGEDDWRVNCDGWISGKKRGEDLLYKYGLNGDLGSLRTSVSYRCWPSEFNFLTSTINSANSS